jgi:hypothetical protein
MNDKWKLVPVEPTPEMLEAGRKAVTTLALESATKRAWAAMLAAAPQPPEPGRAESDIEWQARGYRMIRAAVIGGHGEDNELPEWLAYDVLAMATTVAEFDAAVFNGEAPSTIPMVLRPATGRTIPDLTHREHVCEWQSAIKTKSAPEPGPLVLPDTVAPAATFDAAGGDLCDETLVAGNYGWFNSGWEACLAEVRRLNGAKS